MALADVITWATPTGHGTTVRGAPTEMYNFGRLGRLGSLLGPIYKPAGSYSTILEWVFATAALHELWRRPEPLALPGALHAVRDAVPFMVFPSQMLAFMSTLKKKQIVTDPLVGGLVFGGLGALGLLLRFRAIASLGCSPLAQLLIACSPLPRFLVRGSAGKLLPPLLTIAALRVVG